MGAKSRRKGKKYELEVVHALKPLFPSARRGRAQDRNGTIYEDKQADVEGTPYWIEASHAIKSQHFEKLTQASASTDGRTVIAITRRNHEPSIASMWLPDFIAFLKELELLRQLRVGLEEIVKAKQAELDAAVLARTPLTKP